eukprot:XP_015571549.1 probable ubiquitin-like-specific protease 2B isoform X1 [Ricinus communis]
MKNGLEVFDFKEEDELAEYTAGKILGKFKNPNLENPAFLECDFNECVSQGSEVAKRDIGTITCVDVDAMECENSSKDASTHAPPGIVRADSATVDENSDTDTAFRSEPMSHEKDPSSITDYHEFKSSFTEQEAVVSCHASLSPGRIQSNCGIADSPPSNSGRVNEKSDADKSMSESSPSSPASDIADDGATENDHSSDKYFSASEMDIIDMEVDYVVYRGNHCTGCLITFSCGGIKVSGMSSHGDEGTFSFERAIDDIIRIESQQLQRFGTVTVKLHVLSKDAAQAANAYGVEQLEFVVLEPNWSGKLEEIGSLNVKYLALSDTVRDSDATMVAGAHLHRKRPYFPVFEAVEDVVYPKGDSDAVSISKRDFDLLQPETFINDTIIDFYIKYLKNQIPPEEKHRFHFFNSFFFRKLADLDKDPSSASDGRAAFLRVHKWTRKVDIFGKDYVFIPVNFSLHWSLLIICHPGELAGFGDEDLRKSPRTPCILHMDSIKGTHAGLKNLVQSYLWEEWKSRHKETSEDLSSKFLNLWFVPLELPQQENSFDCGLFLLHYLELFLADAPVNFSPFKINRFSKFLNVDWFPPAEASLKRTLIQRLISGLLEHYSHEVSSGDCSDKPESNFLENNGKEIRVQFVSERCTQAVACHGNLSSCNANQGIEITLLEASSMRNSDSVNDPGLVLREFFEPGVPAGSLLAQCSSFDQPSYYRLNGAISHQIEQDDAEAREQFVYFPSGDSIFQQDAGSIPYPLRGFGADSSWNPGVSMQGEHDGSSSETSECASDDSDVGIIENCSIVKDMDQSREEIGQQRSQSIENMECLTERLASGSSEMLETSAINGTEDPDKIHDTTENGDLAYCQEIPSTLQIDYNMVENGSHQHYIKAAISGESDDVTAESDKNKRIDDNAMAESDEKQRVGENVMAESDEKQTVGDDAMAESDEEQTVGMAESDEKQTVSYNLMSESDEKQRTDDNGMTESYEKQTAGGNVMAESDEKQIIDDSAMAESDEEQAPKRRRVTPLHEGDGDINGNLWEDIHL